MTREEILEAIANDKMMPFIQPEQLAGIVDFVIKNYNPFLSSNLEEASHTSSEEFVYNSATPFPNSEYIAHRIGFKTGAKWQAEQGGSIECEVDWIDGPFLNFTEEQLYHVLVEKGIASGDKVIVQIRRKI